MLADIGLALLRTLGFLVRAPVGALGGNAQRTVRLAVSFKLTDNDNKPIAGMHLRLLAGRGDQAAPELGMAIVTDAEGAAAFATDAVIDRRWFWVNVGFTGLSAPHLMTHLAVAVEADNSVGIGEGEPRVPLLCAMDIYRTDGGDCWSQGFARIYAADAKGRFTRRISRRHPEIALPNGMATYFTDAWRVTDFRIKPESRDHWRLELGVAMARPYRPGPAR